MSSAALSTTRPSPRGNDADEPAPRGSNHTRRLNDARRSRKRTNLGSSHITSIVTKGSKPIIGMGPDPTTWYAIWPPSTPSAYRVSAIGSTSLSSSLSVSRAGQANEGE